MLYSFIFSPPVTFGDSPLVRGGLWCGITLLGELEFNDICIDKSYSIIRHFIDLAIA